MVRRTTGAAGEGDNILAAEFFIQGGSGGDTVTGFDGAEGNGGNDRLVGGSLEGGAGHDTLRGTGSFDSLLEAPATTPCAAAPGF
jgi:hypothetical protein